MKFLIDSALSPRVAAALTVAGHDAVHVRDRGLQTAPDDAVFNCAALEARIIVSADTDFGAILASRRETKPSFILFRGDVERRPEEQARLIVANLPALTSSLETGCIVSVSRDRLRVRELPLK